MNNNIRQITDDEKEEKKQETPEALNEKFLKTRQILLSGEINKALAEKVIQQLLMMEAENDKPIYVFIDSPGGDADAGYAILDMMRFINAPVYTIGMGLVASAGALILLASPKNHRLGLPNSHYLIHQPSSGMKGVATDIQIHAEEIEKMRTKINVLISEQTGKKLDAVVKDTERDYWLTAKEAISYGLIEKIITSRDDLK
jgi:ATP-dependent Clp protease protease subunit